MMMLVRRFSQLAPKNSPDSFLKRIKEKLMGRSVIYRLLMVSSIGLTLASIYLARPKVRNYATVLSISNTSGVYYQPSQILELGVGINQKKFYMIGIIKPGTIVLVPGTMKHTFTITDFIHEVKIYFEGVIPVSLKEGETVRVQGEFVNEYDPVEFIASFIEAPHEAEQTKVDYQARSRDIELKQRPMSKP